VRIRQHRRAQAIARQDDPRARAALHRDHAAVLHEDAMVLAVEDGDALDADGRAVLHYQPQRAQALARRAAGHNNVPGQGWDQGHEGV